MATSSSGRQSLNQWQKVASLIKEYVSLQQSRYAAAAAENISAHPVAKSAAFTEQEGKAVAQALALGVHKIRAAQASKNIAKAAASQVMRKGQTISSSKPGPGVVKEFLSDGCIPTNNSKLLFFDFLHYLFLDKYAHTTDS